MNGNKNLLIPALLLCLALLSAGWSRADESVSKGEAVEFVRAYQQALQSRDAAGLDYLFSADARIRIELLESDGKSQQFTLTPQRFLQQIRAVWHFAAEQTLVFGAPEYDRDEQGVMRISLQQRDERMLFGARTGQQDQLTLKLQRQGGQIRLVDLHSVSRLW